MTKSPDPSAAKFSGARGRARSAPSRRPVSLEDPPVGSKTEPPAESEPSAGRPAPVPPRQVEAVVNSTSRIVQRAASILEEELRAGIKAAQQVERQLLNVSELRAGHPEEVMQRFRRDAHEVVDMLIDIVNAATNTIGGLAQRVVTLSSGSGKGSKAGSRKTPGAVLTLAGTRSYRPGQTAELPMLIENDSESATDEFRFQSSDLIDVVSGGRIQAQQVSFTPSPLTIGPRESVRVTVAVAVPMGTPSGSYAGLVQASRLDHLRAVLQLQVG